MANAKSAGRAGETLAANMYSMSRSFNDLTLHVADQTEHLEQSRNIEHVRNSAFAFIPKSINSSLPASVARKVMHVDCILVDV